MSRRIHNTNRIWLALLTSLVLVFMLWLSWQTHTTFQANDSKASVESLKDTKNIAKRLAGELGKLEAATVDLKCHLTPRDLEPGECKRWRVEDELSSEYVEQVLEIASLNHDGFYSLGVAFKSGIIPLEGGLLSKSPARENECGGKHCLYAPYLIERQGSIENKRIDSYYDYREVEYGGEWYVRALKSAPGWSRALKEHAMDEWVVKYTQQLKHDGETIGVVFADIGLEWFREWIETHDLTRNGYAILVNEVPGGQRSQILYHGLESTETIRQFLDLSLTGENSDLNKEVLELEKSINAEERRQPVGQGGSPVINRLTGENAWFNKTRIGKSSMYLLTVMNYPFGAGDAGYYSVADIRNPGSSASGAVSWERLTKKLLGVSR